ncbi:hypothetical protein BDC45DRAFT_29002 [Circinella umbellata]|nr:hypothetical protein BDC45DRAFT_29002 [Circinella umbellata]
MQFHRRFITKISSFFRRLFNFSFPLPSLQPSDDVSIIIFVITYNIKTFLYTCITHIYINFILCLCACITHYQVYYHYYVNIFTFIFVWLCSFFLFLFLFSLFPLFSL